MEPLSKSIPENGNRDASPPLREKPVRPRIYWRVEGSLLTITAVRQAAFFTWNSHSFLERWTRRGLMGVTAVARPFAYSTHRVFATRLLHAVLRGVSQDRLDSLGEEYFQYRLKPRLNPRAADNLHELLASGADVVLVSQSLEHIMRPLAQYLGVEHILSNRLEFRDCLATGRLLRPVIRPRGPLALLAGNKADGIVPRERLVRDLGLEKEPGLMESAIHPVQRIAASVHMPVISSSEEKRNEPFSVREALRGKTILLIGATGFIGKVWLAMLLESLPEIGRVYLLVRRNRAQTASERFQRMIEESPAFDVLAQRQGDRLADFLRRRVEVVEGDVTQPALGMNPAARAILERDVDVVINSSGLTDFNPDLRDALSSNVRAVAHLLDFLRGCHHAALLHLSTCYVTGFRNGRVAEGLEQDYCPARVPGFSAEKEWESLEQLIREIEARAESEAVTREFLQQARDKRTAAKDLRGAALENQIRKNRVRWLRKQLTEAATRRANELGWPNTYTLTKSLAESLIASRGRDLPIAVVRPAIVESSVRKPFPGWNEGINTSASLSYLLGTYFRQLPTNQRKCLDIIPVDVVCGAMTLIAAALAQRRHEPVYQLATSVSNPCDMRRSIELTSLAHRKHYRGQKGFQYWLRSRLEAIPVSKQRYERLSAPAQKALVQALSRSFEPLSFVRPLLARRERELERVIRIIALFEPFILYNNHVFEAANIESLSAMLPSAERSDFGYDARSIDWWDYWINIHIPALRRWCYPLIEGRPPEERPRRSVPLELPAVIAAESRSIDSLPEIS
jgi:thioester reductase-like protein